MTDDPDWLDRIDFDKAHGLVPAIVQDRATGEILMLAYASRDAVRATIDTGLAHFHSRSRQALWKKGETSGNAIPVREIRVDCDGDTLIYDVDFPEGPACHTGARSCFVESHAVTPSGDPDARELARLAADLWRAYKHLRDHDLEAESGTSRLLRNPNPQKLATRLGDEVAELLGAVDGSHAHDGQSQAETVRLECTQVWYWALLLAVAARTPFDESAVVEPLCDDARKGETITSLADAVRDAQPGDVVTRACQLIGRACADTGVAPQSVLEHDLKQMRARPYLAEVLAAVEPRKP